jgi:hypothetical protein
MKLVVEQRMNESGRIRILYKKKYVGIPVAYDEKTDGIITYKNLSRRCNAFLDEDGLTRSETNRWLEKFTELNPPSFRDIFSMFSRSLDWGIAAFTSDPQLLVVLKSKIDTKDIQNRIIKLSPTDILITRKFKVRYSITNPGGKPLVESEDMFAHILINSEPAYKAFIITDRMTPFELDDSIEGWHIVEDDNSNLKKSLSRNQGFAYTLDAFKHKNDISNTTENNHAYRLWHLPRRILLSKLEIPPSVFPLYMHVSSYLDIIDSSINDWLQSIGNFSQENHSEELDAMVNIVERIISCYLSLQNFRLPKQ